MISEALQELNRMTHEQRVALAREHRNLYLIIAGGLSLIVGLALSLAHNLEHGKK